MSFLKTGIYSWTYPRLTILIASKLLLFLCLFHDLYANRAPLAHKMPAFESMGVLRYQPHKSLGRIKDNVSVIVKIMGDPKSQTAIKLRIIAPDLTMNFDLQKAESVAHRSTFSVSLEKDSITGRTLYRKTYLQPDVLALCDTFFHNTENGTVVSVTQQPNGDYHVNLSATWCAKLGYLVGQNYKGIVFCHQYSSFRLQRGHLTHTTLIAPDAWTGRYKRALRHRKTHTLYSVPEDRDRDLSNYNSFQLAMGNDLLNSVEPKDSNEWEEKKGPNSMLSEWNREEREFLEEESELDMEDDYLEVPSIFDSEEAWEAHQSQSLANFNFVHEKEDEEKDFSSLMFQKSEQKNKRSRNRKRRTVEPKKHTNPKHESEYHKAAIYVDRSSRVQRRFRTNINPEHTAKDLISILKENARDTKLGKVDIQTLFPDIEKAGKHTSGIKTNLRGSGQSAYRISNSDLLSIGEEANAPKVNITFINKGKKAFLRRGEISRKILPFQPNKLHRRRRQVPQDTRNIPTVSQGHQTGVFHRSNADFVVEVAAIVDVSIYKEFNYDWKQLQIFLLHFWQSVNARFQAMVDPKVQLKLKSINKIMFESMQPFIEQNRISPMSERVNVASVLEDFRAYVSEHYEANSQMPDHDIAILVTGEDLCKKKPDGTWSKSSRGIAFVQGACISSRRFQNQTYDVGVAEVGRSYRGVLTTAHEVGHLLGAFHDGEKSSRSCPAKSGHLMSQTWSKPYLYNRFSQCSRQNFRNFMRNTWYSDCLLSSDPRHSQALTPPNTRPGQVLTLDRQCHFYIGGKPCRNAPLESQCGRLCCEKWSRPFPSNEPAADGTECGQDKMCFNGECLHKFALPPIMTN